VSEAPTVTYRPKALIELLNESIEESSKRSEVLDGTETKFIILKVSLVEFFCKKIVTVAAFEECVLAINIELILLTPSPGASSSTVG